MILSKNSATFFQLLLSYLDSASRHAIGGKARALTITADGVDDAREDNACAP